MARKKLPASLQRRTYVEQRGFRTYGQTGARNAWKR